MRLAKLTEFRSLIYSPDSAPAMSTLRARIDREEIPGGRKDGKRYYVDLDEFDTATKFRQRLHERQRELSKHQALQGLI